MKPQIEKLSKLLREIELDEYLNEETLPKIREAMGVLCEITEQLKCDHSYRDDSLMGVEMKRCWKCGKGENE